MNKRLGALIFALLGILSMFIDGDATFTIFAVGVAWIIIFEDLREEKECRRRKRSSVKYANYYEHFKRERYGRRNYKPYNEE